MNITPVVRKQSSYFVAGKQRHSNICHLCREDQPRLWLILCWLKIEDWHQQRVWSHHTCAPWFELHWLQTGDECQRMWNHGQLYMEPFLDIALFETLICRLLADISLWSHPDAFKYHLWFVRCSSYGFPSTENSFLATRTSPNTRRVNHLPGVSPSIWHSAWSCLIIWQTRSQWAAPTPYVTGRDLSWWWCFFSPAFVKHSVDDSEIHHHHQHHHHIQPLWTDTAPSPVSTLPIQWCFWITMGMKWQRRWCGNEKIFAGSFHLQLKCHPQRGGVCENFYKEDPTALKFCSIVCTYVSLQ